MTNTASCSRLTYCRIQRALNLRRQPPVEPAGLFGVLVDLVLAHLAPGHPAPDHVAVVVNPAVLGIVEVDVAADADRLPPGEALEDHLVGVDLQPDLCEAGEPLLQLPLVARTRRERAVAG